MDQPIEPPHPHVPHASGPRPVTPPDPMSYALGPGEASNESGPPAPQSASTGSRGLRDPGSPRLALVAWLFVALAVSVVVGLHQAESEPEASIADAAPRPGGILDLLGRYAFAANRVAAGAGDTLVKQLDTLGVDPADRLRIAIIAGEVEGDHAALDRLAKIESGEPEANGGIKKTAPPPESPKPPPAWLEQDVRTLRAVYGAEGADVDGAARQELIDHHGWFAKAALSHGKPDDDPLRAEVIATAERVMAMLFIAASVGGVAFFAGLVLAIIAIVKIAGGKLRPRYAPPAPGGSVFVETFAIFLGLFIVVSLGAEFIAGTVPASDPNKRSIGSALIWILPFVALWPLVRGCRADAWRYALGWHRGRGVFREIGAGIAGYLAGMPVFVAGIFVTLLLAKIVALVAGEESAPPLSHPIINEIGRGGAWGIAKIYLLASVWAPLTEETMFRGALYHHLRGRWRMVASGLLVSFIFAVIHPQGIVAVPALMGLALVFAGIREWRGSIIGCMTAHAIHNGALMTILIVALS